MYPLSLLSFVQEISSQMSLKRHSIDPQDFSNTLPRTTLSFRSFPCKYHQFSALTPHDARQVEILFHGHASQDLSYSNRIVHTFERVFELSIGFSFLIKILYDSERESRRITLFKR
jgi:hypothetical protein